MSSVGNSDGFLVTLEFRLGNFPQKQEKASGGEFYT
jgi:hypothetical protein